MIFIFHCLFFGLRVELGVKTLFDCNFVYSMDFIFPVLGQKFYKKSR